MRLQGMLAMKAPTGLRSGNLGLINYYLSQRVVRSIREIIHGKGLAQCLVYCKCLLNGSQHY